MKTYLKILIAVFITGLFASCNNSSMKLSIYETGWSLHKPEDGDEIMHSIYLIGDAGGATMDESTIPLMEMEKHLLIDNRPDDSTDVIFLGDNIYPVGMPPVDDSDYELAAHRLTVQLEAVRKFDGNVTFVPGNHGWYVYGQEGLRRQEKFIEDYLAHYNEEFTDYFRPSNGCGDVDVMKIADGIALVTMDSHWFLDKKALDEGYDVTPCKVKSRFEMVQAFKDTMALLKDDQVILAMHHPFYTVGSHGGYYKLASHFFPLAEYRSDIRLPLVMTGTIVNYMRPRVSEQDTKSSPYALYRSSLIPTIEEHGNTISVAGHEHTLQYHVRNDVHYIVSGSGSKKGPVGKDAFTRFAYGNYGYAILDYYKSGEIWLSFYANSEDNEEFIEIYRTQIK